ncbi:LacI family DNA-binding transcriptional regulator [Shinella sp.]|uniref:LacI family DNA-binding transcriptional regulator n=1 Tax=Shinella sp. TaxID=1870904 RepID=UPI003F70A254
MPRKASWQGPGLAAIAAEAEVSTSTVDRVMNGRPNVSARSREAVFSACARLGIAVPGVPKIDAPVAQRLLLRRVLLLSDAGETLNERLASAVGTFNRRAQHLRIDAELQKTSDFNAKTFAKRIVEAAGDYDGILLNSRDDPFVRRAINAAQSKDVPVVCITTDIPQSNRAAYVGMNQFSAGAMAAYLMGRFSKVYEGSVILVASAPYVCQEQRESGFRRVLRAEFPGFHIVESIHSLDDPDSAYANMRRVLQAVPAPIGVYNTAGGNTGIARAISDAGLSGKTIFIGHEGSESSIRLLETGQMEAVLTHDIDGEIERSSAIIAALCDAQTPDERHLKTRRPEILTRYTTE